MPISLRLLPSGVLFALTLAGCSDLGRPVRLLPHAEVSSASLDFGSVALSDSVSLTVTVRNSGSADLTGNASVSCAGFRLASGGGPFVIPPGGSRQIVVRFAPGAQGSYSCQLDLGPDCPRVSLAGSGALQAPGALCQIVPGSLDFGNLLAGQTAVRQFTIRSVGTASLTANVVSSCSELVPIAGGGPATIPPGDSVVVQVMFSPQAGGTVACQIATGPGCPSVGVTGFVATVSFANDIQPIFDTNCTSCHVGTVGNGGLDLTPGSSYGHLVGVPSPGRGGLLLVKPRDPTNSVLYGKITGTRFGTRMPFGGAPLGLGDIDNIRTWILEGALNN